MASDRSQKKINVGVLSLSRSSVVAPFLNKFENKKNNNGTFNLSFIKLSAEDLDNRDYKVEDEVEAVVLLHSIMEGRFSITDVPDARYNILLPRLNHIFGSSAVGVIAHDMPNFNDVAKRVQMKVFKGLQTTTFACSDCVILCGHLDGMSGDEWDTLTSFLALAPGQRELQPSDEADKPNSVKKTEIKVSDSVHYSQAESDLQQNQMKSDDIRFAIITSDEYSDYFDIIKDDIQASCPISILKCSKNDLEAAWKSAHALALLLQMQDLVDLCRKVPSGIRGHICIFRPQGGQVLTEGCEHFEQFEYQVEGDTSSNCSINFSKGTLESVVSWLKECYQNPAEPDEKQKCVMT